MYTNVTNMTFSLPRVKGSYLHDLGSILVYVALPPSLSFLLVCGLSENTFAIAHDLGHQSSRPSNQVIWVGASRKQASQSNQLSLNSFRAPVLILNGVNMCLFRD